MLSRGIQRSLIRAPRISADGISLSAKRIPTSECATMTPTKKVLKESFGDQMIEITLIRNKGQKRTSPAASLSPKQKTEKKRSTTNNSETPQNWGNVFRQQNLLCMTKDQSPKRNEHREAKKDTNAKRQQKSIPIKHRKSEHSTTPCCSSGSILVQDRAVQSETYLNELDEFNLIRMLHLIKQLKDLVNKKDKRICEIFTEMEQILPKIPDLETRVESSTVPLKESNKKKVTTYESLVLEQEKLKSEILKQEERLQEVNRKNAKLTFHVNMFTQQLDEKNETISRLKQQILNNEKLITDLRTDLNKRTEFAEKNDIDNKCLTMEIDKLSALSSYKDTQIIDYRNTIQELQNQIAEQIKIINEIYAKVENASPQISFIKTGHACSSPTSSFSDDSNKSWHDLELSADISSVNSFPQEHALREDAPVRDFELVSLPDGESSHTLLPDQNEVTNDKGTVMKNNNGNNTVLYQSMNTNDVTVKKSLHHSSKKGHNKENNIYKMRNFTGLKENQNDNTKNLFLSASQILESITSAKSTVSDIRKQGDMQNRKPVNVPSPLRDCPGPDWSDSSLPSISTTSNLDIVPSNDV
ncbi:PREDICTED: uncharacterized protein LOC105449690 isoform X1 [Wasmannia auropunctata]|uniref:uncharacterized protein LOC105449690 isoform X1 n=2 Tax=Wasmannia auropunctata TaxID=64793 RepID=UPI0005F0BE41|nr:PREDICTED: uncharacterized protein LOC105449690 isoform X1 [Wasmannia auropunctata]